MGQPRTTDRSYGVVFFAQRALMPASKAVLLMELVLHLAPRVPKRCRSRKKEGFVVIHNKHTMTGTIIKVVADRGFGFIKPAEGDKELFFHARSVVGDTVFDELKENDAVTYDIEEGPKGPAATNVAKSDAPAAAPAAGGDDDAASDAPAEEAPAEAA